MTSKQQSGAEKKMTPIIDEQEAAFFERPFRAQATNAPHRCGRERLFSSMLRRQARAAPAKHSAALWWREQNPSSIFRLQAISSGTHRVFCGSGANSGKFRIACGSGANSKWSFRAICASEKWARAAVSSPSGYWSSHFEPPCKSGWA